MATEEKRKGGQRPSKKRKRKKRQDKGGKGKITNQLGGVSKTSANLKGRKSELKGKKKKRARFREKGEGQASNGGTSFARRGKLPVRRRREGDGATVVNTKRKSAGSEKGGNALAKPSNREVRTQGDGDAEKATTPTAADGGGGGEHGCQKKRKREEVQSTLGHGCTKKKAIDPGGAGRKNHVQKIGAEERAC